MLYCYVIILFNFLFCFSKGVVFGVLSSAFVALNSIYVKKILPLVGENSEKLMLYNNINAIIILFPIILFFTDEVNEIRLSKEVFRTTVFWTLTVVAGIVGYLINFASYLQIKFTSPLSHNVSGTAKAAAQTVIALLIFRNPVTLQGIVGVIVVILDSLFSKPNSILPSRKCEILHHFEKFVKNSLFPMKHPQKRKNL
ncbi:GDP-L-fucose transporter [Reticulomyxa filosa]|uniref:GDP-L-fucose transporter n=1 Tax=Reticulomyxa filosa TaxID=46433 RepID=X6M853_RETFI|nr:GDP-L-fucose transporter [Reticulomyxa filosa]|eukprot:ETO10163.1 GDP-L-fucose transporter [Reticulomyxa filosa]